MKVPIKLRRSSTLIMMKHHTNMNIIPIPFMFCVFLFSWIFMTDGAQNTAIEVNVGVILDFDSRSGENYFSCMDMALSDFYASNPNFRTRVKLLKRNSKNTVVGAAAAAVDLINNVQVQAIIGPEKSMLANIVVNVGNKTQVPILTFSASSPSLTSLGSSFFFQLTQSDSIQVKAISGVVQKFAWREIVPIFEDTSYGEGIIPFLIDALQEVQVHVPYRSVVSDLASDGQIEVQLRKLMEMPTRVFIVHMNPQLCSKLFAMAKKIGMMRRDYVWIIASGISNRLSSMKDSQLNSMEGVLGIQTYIQNTSKLREFERRWKMKVQQNNPNITNKVKLNVYGFQAHDAVWALAKAVEQVGYTSIEYQKGSDSFKAINLNALKVSQHGQKLAQALSSTSFEGLAGNFNVVEGELQSSTFQIINIVGGEVKEIELWSPPEKGTVTKNISKILTSSKCNSGPIKWPGGSYCVPKGWEIPANEKKLRIGVPVKEGFKELVNITKDHSTNTTIVEGFCIEVFRAAVKLLPYELPHEFIPFENSSGLMNGTYNDLVYQVFLKEFDAVVGDITIRANRSLLVDFTMPYTKSDVGMVVPVGDSTRKNAWIFMKPFTWKLWLTTLCYFIVIAFVVWVLEHRVNEDFRGPPSNQVGTTFWFSFSTMVFTHQERVVSNPARFVMVIWIFVMLTVTQSYTANLSSLLTVQQLQPTITDLNDLLRNGDTVGYSKNSFVREILIEMGFNKTKLREIKSAEDGDKEFKKGSTKGGIAAFVGGTPTLEIFVAKYCSRYTIVGPIFKTNGIAFVFPKRSPLVADMSTAILSMTETMEIKNISDAWINNKTNCDGSSSGNISGYSLGLDSFWGLFLIAGVASVLALIRFFVCFLYEHKHVLMPHDPRASTWTTIRALFQNFDDRDGSSYTFRSNQPSNKIIDVSNHVPNASPGSSWPESPLSYKVDGELDYVCDSQETPPTSLVKHLRPERVLATQLAIYHC